MPDADNDEGFSKQLRYLHGVGDLVIRRMVWKVEPQFEW